MIPLSLSISMPAASAVSPMTPKPVARVFMSTLATWVVLTHLSSRAEPSVRDMPCCLRAAESVSIAIDSSMPANLARVMESANRV